MGCPVERRFIPASSAGVFSSEKLEQAVTASLVCLPSCISDLGDRGGAGVVRVGQSQTCSSGDFLSRLEAR